MSFYYYLGIWRKFWAFMEGLYPLLIPIREKVSLEALRFLEASGIKRVSDRYFETRHSQALKSVGKQFYWKDLSRGRDTIAGLSPDSLMVLRPVFLLGLALCLLLPFTLLFPHPAIAPSAITGARGPVAGWSVVLWMLTTALAWSCLVAGAGAANRSAFVVASDFYLFVMMIMSHIGSRLNFLPVSVVLLAAAVCERRMKRPGRRSKLAGLIMCLLIGIPCGISVWMSLPHWHMSHEAGQFGKFVLGGLLGLLAFLLGRLDDAHTKIRTLTDFFLPVHRMVWAAGAMTLLFLSGLAFSMKFGSFADSLLMGERFLTGYFWPIWYFIGVGVIYKLLKNTNILVSAVQDMIRPSLLIPFTLTLLAAALVVTLSYDLLTFADLHRWPLWILWPAWKIFQATKSTLWDKPIYSFSLVLMTWVFVFDLLAVVWLAMKRMLNSERVVGLLFYTLLAWFLILEYYFENFSLARSNSHSVLILFFSSIWLLWFIVSTGLRKCTSSSPMWPSSARLPIYGALLLFILLLFHARTAIRDFRVVNENFYYLFRGIIDVGFPYVLYVYAGRRFGELPVPLSRLFAFFCLGGAITIPLTVLDKLAMVNWSWPALRAFIDAQYKQVLAHGMLPSNQAVALPMHWLAVRAAIVMAILLIAAVGVKRMNSGRSDCTPRVIFFVTALAMGLAAFSNMVIDLPFVPPHVELFYWPLHQSVKLDDNLFFLYLTYNIPALILVLSLTRQKGRFMLLQGAGVVAAALSLLGLTLIWPVYSAVLRKTGLADTLVTGGISLFVLLIYRARIRIDSEVPSKAVETAEVLAAAPASGLIDQPDPNKKSPAPPPERPVVGPVARIVFIVAGSVIFLGVAFFQWHSGHFLTPGSALK